MWELSIQSRMTLSALMGSENLQCRRIRYYLPLDELMNWEHWITNLNMEHHARYKRNSVQVRA